MNDHAENSKRIAKNTLMLYARMLFSMVVSLYTSSVIINALGEVDFGVYGAVGGFVAMFSMISSSLSSSTSRFLTFELGKGDTQHLKAVFSTSLLIHIVLAVLVFILAESIGVWFLNNKMTIPAERLYAANWVFQASIVSFMLSLFSVPYNASIIAHERMSAFAYIGIFDVVIRLGIVLFIAFSPWNFDRLIVYSLLVVALGIINQTIYLWYCRRNFEECQLRISFDRTCWKEMSGFAGWNFIGCTAGLLKDHGVNILLNIFIGPVLNTARSIAGTVNGAVSSFAGNFMVALNPQITKSYASGDHTYMFSLVERGSRFSFYIILILALPILFETEFILDLWLKQYPAHTVNFIRLILLLTLSDILSNTLINLQAATGKIRNYQLAVGSMLMMNFPLSYVCLHMGFPPESTLIVALFVSVCCMILRLWFLRKMVNMSMRHFLKYVYLNVWIVSLTAAILPTILHTSLHAGWQRFLILVPTSICWSILAVYFIGCSQQERVFLNSKIRNIKQKFIR
ncbi:MAG: lipopolysaccharide biosynthesis protein [Bacteroidaceae bacterium]|nr:lipopolysaccharide biosynthesis protein [Bacteroidaceae bacterium]